MNGSITTHSPSAHLLVAARGRWILLAKLSPRISLPVNLSEETQKSKQQHHEDTVR